MRFDDPFAARAAAPRATAFRGSWRTTAAFVVLGALSAAACGQPVQPGPDGGTPGSGGAGPIGTGGAVGTGGVGGPLGSGGVGTGVGGTGSGGAPTGTGGAATGSGGDWGGHYDHCKQGYLPHPSDADAAMVDGPAEFIDSQWPDEVDLTLQPQVLSFMGEHHWEAAHVEWHAIRGCSSGQGNALSNINICDQVPLIPANQNCRDKGDGYEFLVFHRHMIQALKQLWPNHSEQFTAFTKFPVPDDLPPQWKARLEAEPWTEDELAVGKIGDEMHLEENYSRFADEGELGYWLQCFYNSTPTAFSAPNMPWVGIHFSLHDKWNHAHNTAHGLNNGDANINNYMFWKLHGWIDGVWEKYRDAKGLPKDDPKLTADLEASCYEMDTYIALLGDEPIPDDGPLPVESGVFHEQVRPLFENQVTKCSGCHGASASGAAAALSLGGHISSADILTGLVNQTAYGGGQYKLVVPGKPLESWLYLKVAGLAPAPPTGSLGACVGTADNACRTGVMPPRGGSDNTPTLGAAELQIIYDWIAAGAAGPP